METRNSRMFRRLENDRLALLEMAQLYAGFQIQNLFA